MKFPDLEALTHQEAAANEAMQRTLLRGKYYNFEPVVKATGIPTGGPKTCELTQLEFNLGWYIGFQEGNHVFQGKPIDDPRTIPIPEGCKHAPNLSAILESLRECYFPVLFAGGAASKATIVEDARVA